jgi:hypothetical protein
MASIFLMPQAVPLPSQSKIAGLPGQAGTGQPVQTSPFDFSSEQWSTIQQLLQCMAEINSPQGNEIFAQVRNKVAQKSRIGSLAAAFNQFATVAAPFSSAVMPNMLMMANYVSNYGNQVVPSAYSALASLLDALQTQAPTPGDRRHFDAILLQCTEEANNYAQQAASIVDPINSFTEHAANFKSASDSTPQTQLVQIIPDVGGAVAMGVSDDHSKVMGRNTDVHDPLQLWNLEYAGKNWTAEGQQNYHFNISVNGQLLRVAQEFPFELFLAGFLQPQLQLVANATDNCSWQLDVDLNNQTISFANNTGFCIDISGNSGWGQGTPVLSFIRNDGGNQHWSFQPKPYYPWDLYFLDVIAPVIHMDTTNAIANLQAVLGSWNAIAEDLKNVSSDIGTQIDIGKPFISSLNILATIAEWKSIAAEATAFVANDGYVSRSRAEQNQASAAG